MKIDIDIPDGALESYAKKYIKRAEMSNICGCNHSLSKRAISDSFKEHIKAIVWSKLKDDLGGG